MKFDQWLKVTLSSPMFVNLLLYGWWSHDPANLAAGLMAGISWLREK